MSTHEKTIKIIDAFGMNAEKIAEIIGKSQSTVYDKLRERKYNRFTEDDFLKIKEYCVSQFSLISVL